jgi:hypothetical protein
MLLGQCSPQLWHSVLALPSQKLHQKFQSAFKQAEGSVINHTSHLHLNFMLDIEGSEWKNLRGERILPQVQFLHTQWRDVIA